MRLFDRIHEFKKIFLKREQENTEFIRNENLEKLMEFSVAINDLLQEFTASLGINLGSTVVIVFPEPETGS